MNVGQLLRTSAREVAAGVPAPRADPDRVRAAARRTARRRATATGAVAASAAVVAALALTRAGAGDGGPAPVPTPVPSPLRVASAPVWGDAAGLHVGAREYPPPADADVLVVAPVADGLVYGDALNRVWLQPPAGPAVEIGHYEQPALAGGASSVAAWMEPVDGGLELVVFDTASRLELGRARLPDGGSLPRAPVNGDRVENPGPFSYVGAERVIYTDGDEPWSFDVASGRHRSMEGDLPYGDPVDHVPQLSAVVNTVWDRDAPDFHDRTITFWLGGHGPVSSLVGAEPSGAFSPDGSGFATVVESPAGRQHVAVVDVGSGRSRSLPGDPRLRLRLGWARGDTQMVRAAPAPGTRGRARLLACDVGPRTCRDVAYAGSEPLLPVG